MPYSMRQIISLLLALIAAGLVFLSYNQFVNKNALRVLINGVFLAETRIEISSLDHAGKRTPIETLTAAKTTVSEPILVSTSSLNMPIDRLEVAFYLVDPSADVQRPTVAVHSLQVSRPYAVDLFYGANVVYDLFSASARGEPNGMATLAGPDNANVLTSNSALTAPNYLNAALLATMFFFAIWFIVRNGNWRKIPAFEDMSLGRDISSSHEFGTINGIRGIAALLVLLSHTAPGFFALGVGLAMLFVISGFLLSKPFILNKQRIYSFDNIEVYITKRLKRILPMYYLYIFMVYVVTLQLDTALRHFLFVEARGHLWPMTQIFGFYLMLPFLLLLTSALHRVSVWLPIIGLSLGAFFWRYTMTDWMPFFNGSYFQEFYLYAFLIGVAAAYLNYGWLAQSNRVNNLLSKLNTPLAWLGLIVLILTVAWSAPVRPPNWFHPYITEYWMKSVLSAVIIILALNTRGTLFNLFIRNAFFRSVGIVGFSFYILHGLGMEIVLSAQQTFLGIPEPSDRSWGFFAASLVVTYAMSLITYSYVERPFFGFRKTRAK